MIDCQDIHAQAHWSAGVLEWQLVFEDEAAIVPKHEQDRALPAEEWLIAGPALVFGPVPEGKAVQNRLHLDVPRISLMTGPP